MGDFSEDLKTGLKAQDFLIKELEGELPGLKSTQGNFPDYDLISNIGKNWKRLKVGTETALNLFS